MNDFSIHGSALTMTSHALLLVVQCNVATQNSAGGGLGSSDNTVCHLNLATVCLDMAL